MGVLRFCIWGNHRIGLGQTWDDQPIFTPSWKKSRKASSFLVLHREVLMCCGRKTKLPTFFWLGACLSKRGGVRVTGYVLVVQLTQLSIPSIDLIKTPWGTPLPPGCLVPDEGGNCIDPQNQTFSLASLDIAEPKSGRRNSHDPSSSNIGHPIHATLHLFPNCCCE